MKQIIVADPKAMGNDIELIGSVAVYGIHIDTDISGDPNHNMKFSENRAKAVVDALVKKYGISAKRLINKGVNLLSKASINKIYDDKQLKGRK
jgi:hypothetical protein